MKKFLRYFFLLVLIFYPKSAFSYPKKMSHRTVMVQLFEWPWKDIALECENYLGPMGFSAVQISPPQEHMVTGQNFWWERYQPVSYKLESRSGSEAELKDMIQRCQKVGVGIYIDVVINHMAAIDSNPGFAGTHYKKYEHPGLYSFQDFNHCGKNGNDHIVNYMDRDEVQTCELLGLADLKTGSDYVQGKLADYIRHFIDLGAAGFRIDAAKHIPATDLLQIIKKVGRNSYYISETFIGLDEPIKLEEYTSFSDVNVFQFPFQIGRLFRENKIENLGRAFLANYPTSSSSVVFIENHDLQRIDSGAILSYAKNPEEYKLANIFMLTWPYGYPQVFSGYAFQDFNQGPPVSKNGKTLPILDKASNCSAPWICEHRLPWMSALVNFRNSTDAFFYVTDVWAKNQNQFAFGRGRAGFVVINNNSNDLNETLTTSLADGVYCNLAHPQYNAKKNICPEEFKVKSGKINVHLGKKSALVIQAETNLIKKGRL